MSEQVASASTPESFGRYSGSLGMAPGSLPLADRRADRLARVVETQVVPRLVLAHRAAAARAALVTRPRLLGDEQVQAFAGLVLAERIPAASAYVADMRGRGAAVEELFLDLLAPAARHLGDLWEEDLCDFTQVTIGLWNMQQVMRTFVPAFQEQATATRTERRALLVPAPGENHTFGLAMVTEFFRRGGWEVWSGAPESMAELLAMVRREWFAVVGFSVAWGAKLDMLAGCIRQIRRVSRNESVGVMIGGPMLSEHPELVAQLGADATATDGRHAVIQANALLAVLARPR